MTVKDIEKASFSPRLQGCARAAAGRCGGRRGCGRVRARRGADRGWGRRPRDRHCSRPLRGGARMVARVRRAPMRCRWWPAMCDRGRARALIGSRGRRDEVGDRPRLGLPTPVIAGVGVPQLTALLEIAEHCREEGVPVIADGGVRTSGDLAGRSPPARLRHHRLAVRRHRREPGEVFLFMGAAVGRRGMGSLGAMARGSADRYFRGGARSPEALPEGIEGRCPTAGLWRRSSTSWSAACVAMGYTGNATITAMSGVHPFAGHAGGRARSHVHDVAGAAKPDYRQEFGTRRRLGGIELTGSQPPRRTGIAGAPHCWRSHAAAAHEGLSATIDGGEQLGSVSIARERIAVGVQAGGGGGGEGGRRREGCDRRRRARLPAGRAAPSGGLDPRHLGMGAGVRSGPRCHWGRCRGLWHQMRS